jgi:hypothetical protein
MALELQDTDFLYFNKTSHGLYASAIWPSPLYTEVGRKSAAPYKQRIKAHFSFKRGT